MRHNVMFRTNSGTWAFVVCGKRREFRTLVAAIDFANALRIHVDNINQLPLTQYKIYRK